MAWKCDKCGMPNFGDEDCKLCGTPKPENPEEFVEEPKAPEVEETPMSEPIIVFDSNPGADESEVPAEEPADVPAEDVPAEVPADVPVEDVPAEVPADVPVEDAPAEVPAEVPVEEVPAEVPADVPVEDEPAEVPADVPVEDAPAEVPADVPVEDMPAEVPADVPVEDVSEEEPIETVDPDSDDDLVSEDVVATGKKKGVLIAVICLVVLAVLCATGLYMHMTKDKDTDVFSIVTSSATPAVETIVPPVEPSEFPTEDPAFSTEDPAMQTESAVKTAEPSAVATPGIATKTPQPTTKATAKPVATPKPATTPKPVATPKPTPEPWDDSFKKFVSDDYGFYCAYPAQYTVLDNNTNDALLTAVSPDGTIHVMVQASKNWDKLSAKDAMSRYIGMLGGEVQYQECGDNWYAASVKVGDRVYYRKAYVTNDTITCFSFEYGYEHKDVCESYIRYMNEHFKKN